MDGNELVGREWTCWTKMDSDYSLSIFVQQAHIVHDVHANAKNLCGFFFVFRSVRDQRL